LLDRNLTPYDRRVWEGELPDASRKRRFWNLFRKQKQEKTIPASAINVPVMVETQPVNSAEIGFQGQVYPFPAATDSYYPVSENQSNLNSFGGAVQLGSFDQ